MIRDRTVIGILLATIAITASLVLSIGALVMAHVAATSPRPAEPAKMTRVVIDIPRMGAPEEGAVLRA